MVHVPRPEHAFIGNHTYTIDWLSNDDWFGRDFDMSKDGLTYGHKSAIFIRLVPERAESLYQEIVLHELTHASWDSSGFSLIENWHVGDQRDVEENVILTQTPGMLFLLKQNPHVTKWLLADGQVRR